METIIKSHLLLSFAVNASVIDLMDLMCRSKHLGQAWSPPELLSTNQHNSLLTLEKLAKAV